MIKQPYLDLLEIIGTTNVESDQCGLGGPGTLEHPLQELGCLQIRKSVYLPSKVVSQLIISAVISNELKKKV